MMSQVLFRRILETARQFQLIAEKYQRNNLNDGTGNHSSTAQSLLEQYYIGDFGKVREHDIASGEESSKYKYTGKEMDNSELYYYGARFYNPEIGRFISADSVAGEITSTQSLNKYVYVTNNPMKYVDPSGKYIESAIDAASITWSIHDVTSNPRDWTNWLALSADVITAAFPFIAGGGMIVRAVKSGDNIQDAMTATQKIDKSFDAGKELEKKYGVDNAKKLVGGSDNFDDARRLAMDQSGLSNVNPSDIQFTKADPVTGTYVEFKGPNGKKVAYDTPHPNTPGKHHGENHVHAESEKIVNEVFPYSGQSYPGRTTKKIHEAFEKKPIETHRKVIAKKYD